MSLWYIKQLRQSLEVISTCFAMRFDGSSCGNINPHIPARHYRFLYVASAEQTPTLFSVDPGLGELG